MHLVKNVIQGRGDKLNKLLNRYNEIFNDEPGTIQGVKAKIHVKDGSKPKFCKARSVPFAMRQAVEKEIERLEELGIITPVANSEWAIPIVIVPKSDGSVRLCGDYKNTINPHIDNDVYPIPSVDEVFEKMQGGSRFTKIDLTQAYLQVELHESSKDLLVINTCKGLKRPNRMLNGVKPATGIFQRRMDNALCDAEKTVVRIDDILLTEKDDDEHLSNIEKTTFCSGFYTNTKTVCFFQIFFG